MHMLVSVLQNRLKPIWPSLYHQLKVASHQDGPSTGSPGTAGGRGCPPGLLGETAALPAHRNAPSAWLHLPPHADAKTLCLHGFSKGRFAGLASALAGTKLALQAAGQLLSRGENAAAPPVRVRDCPCPCSEEKEEHIGGLQVSGTARRWWRAEGWVPPRGCLGLARAGRISASYRCL